MDILERKKNNNKMKREEYPRYILKHPNNKIEIVFAKVDPSMLTENEKDFLINPEIDYITVYYLTECENYDEKKHGKVIYHRDVNDLIKSLENAKNRAKSEQEKLDIDQQITYLISLAEKAKITK